MFKIQYNVAVTIFLTKSVFNSFKLVNTKHFLNLKNPVTYFDRQTSAEYLIENFNSLGTETLLSIEDNQGTIHFLIHLRDGNSI